MVDRICALVLCVSVCWTISSGCSKSGHVGSDAGAGVDGGTTGGGDGGPGPGGGDGGTSSTPITTPTNVWTWVPFDDAFCADGSTTGIGVNLSTAKSRVLIYMEGGGACWSEQTCYTLMTASNFANGYGAAQFSAESTATSYLAQPGGFFDRTAAANPFKDYSYVYIPYCTGDIHAGNHVMQYGTHTAKHVGFANMTAYLKRLVPTFSGADRVYLSGSSAGGFGALVSWWQAQEAFGSVRVDLIDDSGTPMPADVAAMSSDPTIAGQQNTSWNLAATLPAGCSGCGNGLDALFAFYAGAFPKQKGALLSYQMDSVLPQFDGITTTQFATGLGELETGDFQPHSAQLGYFVVGQSGHVLLFSPTLMSTTDTVQSWLTKLVTDDAGWSSQAP